MNSLDNHNPDAFFQFFNSNIFIEEHLKYYIKYLFSFDVIKRNLNNFYRVI